MAKAENGNGNGKKEPKPKKEKAPKKPSIFKLIVDALRKGPKTIDQIAEIIAKNSAKITDIEQAKKTVAVRMYNLKKSGYDIQGGAKEGKFTLVKEPKDPKY